MSLQRRANRKPFQSAFFHKRRKVIARDAERCRKCGHDAELEVHHIEGYGVNDMDTLVTLCTLCHGNAPMGRDEYFAWERYGESGPARWLRFAGWRFPTTPPLVLLKAAWLAASIGRKMSFGDRVMSVQERNMLSYRSTAGIDRARKAGKVLGRPKLKQGKTA
jgi:hypothetical protein